ncbi:hypothetical protein B566_EDAN002281 [Ephemera danica]|nr:hypothetical protein B566_EDAN002281 [Ephemera danica]
MNCVLLNNELQNKINILEAEKDAIPKEDLIMQTTPISELNPGVEGQWVAVHNGAVPSDVMATLADGKTKSHFDYVGRTKLTENPEVVVLTNNQYKWKWTNSSLPIPNNAIIGGFIKTASNNRELLYIGRAIHDQFVKQGFSENELLMGEIDGNRRELVHVAWGVLQTKTTYQILVSS